MHTIRPMLDTVRMHPMLVTHSRDHEKTSSRWRKMELHDVIVESSKYSLVNQESAKEEGNTADDEVNLLRSSCVQSDLSSAIHGMLKQDPLWTPGRVIGLSTPPPNIEYHSHPISPGVVSRMNLDSPPEPAIEATPETTPFVTPVKVS